MNESYLAGVPQSIKKPESSPTPEVKDSWFQGYMEGNVTIPQMTLGINIFVTSAVLESLKINWQEFRSSKLDEDQLTKLGDVMSGVHRAHSIEHSDERNMELFSPAVKIVSLERLRGLWNTSTLVVLRALTKLLASKKEDGELRDANRVVFLQSYFDDVNNHENLEILSQMIHQIRDAIRSQNIRKMTLTYRRSMVNGRKPEVKEKRKFIDTIRKEVIKELKTHDIDPKGPWMREVIEVYLDYWL